jgi:TilS substrate binding domain
VIRRWLGRHGVTDAALAHVAMVEDLAVDSRGGRRVDLPGLTVARVGPRLRVRRPPEGETGV